MLAAKSLILSNETSGMKISNLKAEWKDKNILIVGAGSTGLSCARFLMKQDIDFTIVDSRKNMATIQKDIEVIFGDFQKKYFNTADILIVSPGVSVKHSYIQQAIRQGKEVIGDVELFCRLTEKPIIAITGSNGKSTVTTLVGKILNASNISAKTGGNIGIPCLDLLADDTETDCYVLELSSFQLETTYSLKAYVSIILNLTEDHLDRYESFSDYCHAKKIILKNSENIIINCDDEKVVEFCAKYNANKISFSLSKKHVDFYIDSDTGREHVFHNDKPLMDISEVKLLGLHNKQNILAALAICSVFDVDMDSMQEIINTFTGLEHRSQLVSHYKGALWINDSKATNIGATNAALAGFANKTVHLIVGGQGKGQDFKELADTLTDNIVQIIIFGEDAGLIQTAIKNIPKIEITMAKTLGDSVELISRSVSAGDVVLFSPACASFDQFKNYMQRGDAFVTAIKGLEK